MWFEWQNLDDSEIFKYYLSDVKTEADFRAWNSQKGYAAIKISDILQVNICFIYVQKSGSCLWVAAWEFAEMESLLTVKNKTIFSDS